MAFQIANKLKEDMRLFKKRKKRRRRERGRKREKERGKKGGKEGGGKGGSGFCKGESQSWMVGRPAL